MISFNRNCQIVFQSVHNQLILPLAIYESFKFSASLPVLDISNVYFSSSRRHIVILHCNFILHIPHPLIYISVF